MKKFILILLSVVAGYQVFSQANISFFHLKNATPQGNNYNASWFPESRAFLSLPGISGVDMAVNNSFGLLDIFTTTGDSTLIDVYRFLPEQSEKSYLNVSSRITNFMFGLRLSEKNFFTLFINERIEGTVFYPIRLANYVWNGNSPYVGQNYAIDDITFTGTHYREYGIGYGHTFNIMGYNTQMGLRVKYLNGFFHSSIRDNLSMNLLTREEDYALVATLNNGVAQSAGVSLLDEDELDYEYLISNGNSGFGVDFGANVDLTEKLSVGLAVNDLGFINWKDRSEIVNLKGVEFVYEGSSFDDIDNIGQAVMDSIENLKVDTVNSTFRTSLQSRVFLTGSYQLSDNGAALATVSNYFVKGRVKSAFGVGYTHTLGKWFAVSGTATVAAQQAVDLGAGFMIRGGFFQMYLSVDNILNSINVPEASSINLKFGINFLFGKPPVPKPENF